MTQAARDIDQVITTEDAIIVPRRRGIKSIEVDDALMEDIRELIHDRAGHLLLNILADLHAADIAELIDRLEPDDQAYVFGLLDLRTGSSVLLELVPEVRGALLESLPSDKITSYVDLLASDDAADLVAELPPHVAEKVLRAMPVKDSSAVQRLMQYHEDTAGGIMGTEYVAVRMNSTVKQAIKVVRTSAKKHQLIYNVYVVDEEGVLVGMLPLQSLVLHAPNKRV